MFGGCGAQSWSRSEEKNLPKPFSKKMSQFSKKMHFLRQSFSKETFSKIIFRKKVIPAQKKKEQELKRKVTAAEEETEALERQLADAEAKKKAKLDQLAALRNSYPVT
jgi:hypothetical protein